MTIKKKYLSILLLLLIIFVGVAMMQPASAASKSKKAKKKTVYLVTQIDSSNGEMLEKYSYTKGGIFSKCTIYLQNDEGKLAKSSKVTAVNKSNRPSKLTNYIYRDGKASKDLSMTFQYKKGKLISLKVPQEGVKVTYKLSYNKKKLLSSMKGYIPNGKCTAKFTFSYDKEGNVTKFKVYDDESKLNDVLSYENVYSKGRLVKRTILTSDGETLDEETFHYTKKKVSSKQYKAIKEQRKYWAIFQELL